MRFAVAALVAVALFVARRADACWCGYVSARDRVSITTRLPNADHCPPEWSPEIVREHADRLARIEAALPRGLAIEIEDGHAGVSARDQLVVAIDFPDDASLLRALSILGPPSRPPPKSRAPVWTVQVFAARSVARAEAVRARADAAPSATTGFFSAGDHPANNPIARVLEGRDHLHRVLAGAFLTEVEARTTARALRAETGLDVFVRTL